MTPNEALALSEPEPDWRERFAELRSTLYPTWHAAMRDDAAFEAVLKEWRQWHYRWDNKTKRLGRPEAGGLALARLGIMPPRSLDPDPDHPDRSKLLTPSPCKELQHDAQTWFRLKQSMWKIRAIEDKTIMLWRGWRPNVEYEMLDMAKYSREAWAKYCDRAVEYLEAWTSPFPLDEASSQD